MFAYMYMDIKLPAVPRADTYHWDAEQMIQPEGSPGAPSLLRPAPVPGIV